VLGFAALHHLLGSAFHLADGPSLRDGFLGDLALQVCIGEREETASVSRGKAALGDELLKVGGKLEEAERIGDGGAIFAGSLADFFGTEREFGAEAAEGVGGFDGIQVLALNVLDEGDFEKAVVGNLPDDYGDVFEAGKLSGPPAALPSD
jgi:hypothetical protein